MKGLKIIRATAATAIFAVALLSFLNFSMGWETNHILHTQFVPALLSVAGGTALPFIILLLLTLIFGRVYCSFLCPTGILQDIISRLARISRSTYNHSHSNTGYRKPHSILRYLILIVTGLLFALGLLWPLTLLDPYSLFGKIASQFFGTIEIFTTNLLAEIFPQSIPYLKYTSIAAISFIYATIALITLILFSATHGRLYCNTICPVGTLLGLIGNKSLLRIRIDAETCKKCNACSRNCKSNCIDITHGTIDSERCVVCFNCLQHCKFGAIHYGLSRRRTSCTSSGTGSSSATNSTGTGSSGATSPSATNSTGTGSTTSKSISGQQEPQPQQSQRIDTGLRTTLAGLAGLGTALIANRHIEGRLIPTQEYRDKHLPKNLRASQKLGIMPPGAVSIEDFKRRCTGCYACVTACPGDVIKPATFEYGADGILLPTLKYNGHFCGYECNACNEACPSGALKPLTLEEKKRTAIGKAIYIAGKCIVFQAGTDCGACDEHCPTKAITMIPVPGKNFLYYPKLNRDLCIGCGGCEYICPQKPKAIKVVALADQSLASRPTEDIQEAVEVNDFGF